MFETDVAHENVRVYRIMSLPVIYIEFNESTQYNLTYL